MNEWTYEQNKGLVSFFWEYFRWWWKKSLIKKNANDNQRIHERFCFGIFCFFLFHSNWIQRNTIQEMWKIYYPLLMVIWPISIFKWRSSSPFSGFTKFIVAFFFVCLYISIYLTTFIRAFFPVFNKKKKKVVNQFLDFG